MPRKMDMATNETTRLISRLRREKAQIRREIRSALSAWRAAKPSMAYATDTERRVREVGERLRSKVAAMNGRVAEINRDIASCRAIHRERAERYAAMRRQATAAREAARRP